MHIFQIDQNSYIQAATNATKPAWQEGLLFWDKDNHTYAVYNDQSGLTLKIGQETLGQIYAGENISAGDAITLSGSLLTYPIGFKAISDGVTKKYNVAGVAAQNILSASKGYVTAQGQVNDVNTSGYSAGSLLYLSGTTPGRYSLTPPDGNAVPTVVGYCLYQHTTAGKMLINISSNASSSSYANHARSASWAPGGSGEPTRIINGSVSASISPAGGLQVNTSASFEGDVLITGYIVNTKTPPANTNLLGYEAGLSASYAHHSNFVGDGAGNQAVYAVYSNFVGAGAGNQAANANNSNFIGTQAGEAATNAENSNFIGIWAGINAAEASFSNFMGNSAGINAVSATNSNFFGAGAGSQATNAHSSNFIGMGSGNWAVNAYESNFIGVSAGSEATEANNSNFIGFAAGQNSVSASYSNFIGRWCGVNAPKANNSIFIGYSAGYADIVDNSVIGKSSILIGDFTSTGGNSNSIAIGQGVQNTLPEQVSIGNVLFATGIYTGTTTTGSVQSNGRVGIGVSNPVNALDVAGNISATVVSASLFAGTASYAKQARSASWAPSSGGGGGSTLRTGSTYPITSSWARNAVSASYAPAPTSATTRTVLLAERTYYVSTTGNDSNNGLTVGAPFATLQKAMDVVSSIDTGIYDVTVQLADGTYAQTVNLSNVVGSGRVIFNGNSGTPANVILSGSPAAGKNSIYAANVFGKFVFQNMELRSTTQHCIYASGPYTTVATGAGIRFGTVPAGSLHIASLFGANVRLGGSYSIVAGGLGHWYASNSATVSADGGWTVTLVGSLAFTAWFCAADTFGVVYAPGITWVGTASGQRYNANSFAIINSGGAGASYFPGSTAGNSFVDGRYY
jgi:hypothetical protein